MKGKDLVRLLLLALPLAAAAGRLYADAPFTLAAEVARMERTQAPVERLGWIVFTYAPRRAARYVALRFAHEGYRLLHPYEVNAQGLFVLLYQPPPDLERVTYRLSVDGVWSTDPTNPHRSVDPAGLDFSHVDLIPRPRSPLQGPTVLEDGRVLFSYRAEPGRAVSIAGTFNNWDPFLCRLEETEPGLYSIALLLGPGEHRYHFLDGGRVRLDPGNVQSRVGADGRVASYMQIP